MKVIAFFEKLIEFLGKAPQIIDWYFGLTPTRRMNLNYITIITVIVTASYYNDHKHNENYTAISNRIDAVNNLRSKEQERYTVKLESYADKFKDVFEKITLQKNEVKQLKQEVEK